MSSAHCPILTPELQRIRATHTTLASTGCTTEFCQAGRAIHTDEPRVGENRALHVVEHEADDFLQTLHHEGFFTSEDAFQKRRVHVSEEIRAGAVESVARGDQSSTKPGGTWTQTPEELRFGLRRAWRNSRKCIMRSHCEELQLCDLRGTTTSAEMAEELINGVSKAFNTGNIQPTVFVFPPCTANGRGPMIWNNQILQFAGYQVEHGPILGDPGSVGLTNAIIELGWQPPQLRSRWDLLPLVIMAEGDCPVLIEIPPSISKLVDICHPQYAAAFQHLNLKWVPFPALTRLGFDIGGVQYTAAPFIGWFMDAEIGVRNLSDTFRYNVLPDVVHALDLTRGKFIDGIEDFEDLPEYEKLAILSKAQTELNYAVHWSFDQAKVTITDTLTASIKWCRYDDEFNQKHGYRLPADPYWLAPPQGSIIPLWHRGGAPNYQPKPMICRHVQDPIRAWQREKHRRPVDVRIGSASILYQQTKELPMQIDSTLPVLTCKIGSGPTLPACDPPRGRTLDQGLILHSVDECFMPPSHDRISLGIYFCSAGTIAEKLAKKVLKWTRMLVGGTFNLRICSQVEPLNNLTLRDLGANKTILLIVSSTGKGDIPANGSRLQDLCSVASSWNSNNFRFAVFGNGDSRYSNTYNGAAMKVSAMMSKIGGKSLTGGIFQGDTAMDPFPLRALNAWWCKVQSVIVERSFITNRTPVEQAFQSYKVACNVSVTITAIDELTETYNSHQHDLLSTLKDGKVLALKPEMKIGVGQTFLLTLKVGDEPYHEMSCVQVLPSTAPFKVRKALWALCLEGSDCLNLDRPDVNLSRYLTDFVDLELPFTRLEWLESLQLGLPARLALKLFSELSVLSVLVLLRMTAVLKRRRGNRHLQRDLCLDMPPLRPRTYSLASFRRRSCALDALGTGQEVDIMVKVHPRGRFSDTFLKNTSMPAALRYRIVDSISGPRLRKNHLRPFVIVATGAGFGPVRCLLQWRIATAREALAAGRPFRPWGSGISLFLGLKERDLHLVVDVLNEAMSVNLVDRLEIVLSNPERRRVYDNLPFAVQHVKNKILRKHGVVFVCASGAAAKGSKRMFEMLLAGTVADVLGERYVEEVF